MSNTSGYAQTRGIRGSSSLRERQAGASSSTWRQVRLEGHTSADRGFRKNLTHTRDPRVPYTILPTILCSLPIPQILARGDSTLLSFPRISVNITPTTRDEDAASPRTASPCSTSQRCGRGSASTVYAIALAEYLNSGRRPRAARFQEHLGARTWSLPSLRPLAVPTGALNRDQWRSCGLSSPLAGGVLADRMLGTRPRIVGGLLMAAGHGALCGRRACWATTSLLLGRRGGGDHRTARGARAAVGGAHCAIAGLPSSAAAP